MESHDAKSPVQTIMAVVDNFTFTEAPDPVPFRCTLCVADGEYTVATWLSPWAMADDQHVDIARITVIPCTLDRDVHWIATRIDYEPEASLIDLIPDTLGADETIVQRFCDVVARIESRPLAMLISRTWSQRKVFRHFWTCPASQTHHHANRGGLASHSIEMAERVADTPSLTPTDRDIAIAYALLHDIGKLWCYDEDGYTHMAQLGHELVGLARINGALDALHHEWPDGALAMRSLLSGLWKTKGKRPLLAIGKLVQAFDQMSAEADMRKRKGHRHEPWSARPYEDNVRPFPLGP